MTQTITSRQEQAEALIVTMDAVQVELEQTSHWQLGASCAAELEGLKSEIVALGYEVKRVPTGWALVEPVVVEVAQVASTPTAMKQAEAEVLFFAEGPDGLYACLKSRNKTYEVHVCAKWLYSRTCTCEAGQHARDCKHRVQIDRLLDEVRPTFKEQVAGVRASRETISELIGQSTMPTKRAA